MRKQCIGLCFLMMGAWSFAETAEDILRRDWLRQAELRFSEEPNLRTTKNATT